jgi:peptide chain release factor 2
VDTYQYLTTKIKDSLELLEVLDEAKDMQMLKELKLEIQPLFDKYENLRIYSLLGGQYDSKNVFFYIQAGAGGTDACDWTEMLLRMYTRWLYKNDYEVFRVEYLPNEEAGIRRVGLHVTGKFPFGFLKSEIGVHRLIRISPFDASKRRHTSFASVDVIPELEEIEIKLKDEELKIETFRASGPGGQHMQKTESAVRITHLPTGITAQCQSERSQYINKQTALKILASKIYQVEESKRKEELRKIYGEKGEISFGYQIRSYFLHPETRVKDHRTGFQTNDIEAVLNGEIDGFIEAFLLWPDRKY